MRGTPVWLASVSRRSPLNNNLIATGLWSQQTRDESAALLRRVLGPAGDSSRERLFRMNVTLCLHRAITAAAYGALPESFRTAEPTDLAGGPIEVLFESEEGRETTKPCHNPAKISLDPRNPLLWIPTDCNQCPPCIARIKLLEERSHAEVG